MSNGSPLPFASILAPLAQSDAEYHDIQPPVYAMGDFRFSLKSLVGDNPDLTLSTSEAFDIDKLQAHSSLDTAQAQAFVAALTRRVALIQGPPGTGKSYTGVALIKVLLKNRERAALGPIICVTFTNHSLDQLLMHLVDHGVEQIVRVGSRSKQEALEKVNLRYITQNMARTRTEVRNIGSSLANLDTHTKTLNELLEQYGAAHTTRMLRRYLKRQNIAQAYELFGSHDADEDGWEEGRGRGGDTINNWLAGRLHRSSFHNLRARPLDELRYEQVASMSKAERRTLYDAWIEESRLQIWDEMQVIMQHVAAEKENLEASQKEIDLRCLQDAHVIGVTTTGLAKITDLLGRLHSKVLICEEAGEVLEAHTLATLLPSIEHLILIGDHQQLRPHIQNYNLSSESSAGKQYSLDVSLFERLVASTEEGLPKVPFETLETQRRMHPSIANLVRSTLYPQLLDAEHVTTYPEVAGLRKRLLWLDHRQRESAGDSDHLMATSHSNPYEARVVVGLVKHLVQQGVYGSENIAVLTPVSTRVTIQSGLG